MPGSLRGRSTFPATPTPEQGQGPWTDGNGCWWVVAHSAADALSEVEGLDEFPIYFGWKIVMERTCICWVDQWDEDREICECNSDYEHHAEAWRIRLVDR